MERSPCLGCGHHLAGLSKDCKRCVEDCGARLEYARSTDGERHVIELRPARELPDKVVRVRRVRQMEFCIFPGCCNEPVARNLCAKHYTAWRRGVAAVVVVLGEFRPTWKVGEDVVAKVVRRSEGGGYKEPPYYGQAVELQQAGA